MKAIIIATFVACSQSLLINPIKSIVPTKRRLDNTICKKRKVKYIVYSIYAFLATTNLNRHVNFKILSQLPYFSLFLSSCTRLSSSPGEVGNDVTSPRDVVRDSIQAITNLGGIALGK